MVKRESKVVSVVEHTIVGEKALDFSVRLYVYSSATLLIMDISTTPLTCSTPLGIPCQKPGFQVVNILRNYLFNIFFPSHQISNVLRLF